MGHYTIEAGRRLLEELSPVSHMDRITRPLLRVLMGADRQPDDGAVDMAADEPAAQRHHRAHLQIQRKRSFGSTAFRLPDGFAG